MKILQIGGGSMGTRRMRDLSSAEDVDVALLDARPDRRQRAADRFSIPTFETLESALAWGPAALSISTPPDRHEPFVQLALEKGLHHFCEADLWSPSVDKIEQISAKKKLVCAPSNSLAFLPMVRELGRIVREDLGALHAYQMSLSTYMPGWHAGEGDEFYARHRNTSAAREMVPFELLWLNQVFGRPETAQGLLRGGSRLKGMKEDVWSLQMRLESGAVGQLTVLMGCPTVLRQGWCFGDAGQIHFDLFSGQILCEYEDKKPQQHSCGAMSQVLEETYRQEILTFVNAVRGNESWPYPYRSAAYATAALAAAERNAGRKNAERVDPAIQPEVLTD
jgi:predicted dehydrogenase